MVASSQWQLVFVVLLLIFTLQSERAQRAPVLLLGTVPK